MERFVRWLLCGVTLVVGGVLCLAAIPLGMTAFLSVQFLYVDLFVDDVYVEHAIEINGQPYDINHVAVFSVLGTIAVLGAGVYLIWNAFPKRTDD